MLICKLLPLFCCHWFVHFFDCRIAQTNRPFFTKFDGKLVHGARKKVLDFGSNQDNVMLWLASGVTVRWEHQHAVHRRICVTAAFVQW